MTQTPNVDRVRARSFGAAAANYDKFRPRYPDQLLDDVVAMIPGQRVLEVGAGTGIATAAFAARGLAMTCVEPDPEMAAVLSAKLAGNADLHVEVATFEDWSAVRPTDATGFDGVISAQAWHWTDPKTRWANAGAAIRTGGVLALFWNVDHFADPRVPAAFTAAYERFGIEIPSIANQKLPEQWAPAHSEAADYFTDVRTRQYPWSRRMSVADYVARINTTSAHLILSDQARDEMTAELIETLTSYGDEIELAMTTDLATAIRR